MLVLTREKDEAIIIVVPDGTPHPATIRIIIADIRGNKVRLGIDAPKNITVDREEIHKARMNNDGPNKK